MAARSVRNIPALKGHDFSRVSVGLWPTQVDENASAASAPEGPKESKYPPAKPEALRCEPLKAA